MSKRKLGLNKSVSAIFAGARMPDDVRQACARSALAGSLPEPQHDIDQTPEAVMASDQQAILEESLSEPVPH